MKELDRLLLYLTYSYKSYPDRDKLYHKLLRMYEPPLIRDNKTEFTGQLGTRVDDLANDGFCYLPKIKKDLCNDLMGTLIGKDMDNMPAKMVCKSDVVMSNKTVLEIFCNKNLVRMVQAYLGVFPSIQYIACWRNTGCMPVRRTNEMHWHMDHHGHRFMKIFIYLEDILEGYGHHQYILGTYRQDKFDHELESNSCMSFIRSEVELKRLLRGKHKLSDDAVWPLARRIRNVVGSKGTCFAEDTRGLHRGTPLPPGKTRTILQCLYTPLPNGKDPTIRISLENNFIDYISRVNGYELLDIEKLF